MKHRDGAGLSVLVFFLCFFFLFSSGRIASQDAGQQLQVAVLLATTGALGQDARDVGPADASWVRAPNGLLPRIPYGQPRASFLICSCGGWRAYPRWG